MQLTDLIGRQRNGDGSLEVAGLTADSREVRPGFVFAALDGLKQDGSDFVHEAIEKGAIAILIARGNTLPNLEIPVIEDFCPRRRLAIYASKFYSRQPSHLVAVTGTSGKTSVAEFARQIWTNMGVSAGSIGTLGVITPNYSLKTSLTTPEPITLHSTLRRLADSGIDHVCVEASSHGLDQFRLDGLNLKVAAFTNFTRDHLDYHGNAEAYFDAKARLFGDILNPNSIAVLPVDSVSSERLKAICCERKIKILTYGGPYADIRLLETRPYSRGQKITIGIDSSIVEVDFPLMGAFQVENLLCALGLVVGCGESSALAAMDTLDQLTGIPGRLQLIQNSGDGKDIYVDYAHKPDALKNVLQVLRFHTEGRLIVVFGCGGERDAGKRLEMGRIAEAFADQVIITDDNPRFENPAEIRQQILEGCPKAIEIGDRRDAIRTGATIMQRGDTLLIAGKGHEKDQSVGPESLPFDDCVEAESVLRALAGAADV